MKRIALLILLVTLISLVLESCGPSPSTTQAPLVEPSATASPTKSVGNADQTSSTPEEESIQYPSLQEDNLYEGTTLEVKLSNQLVDNRIGSVAETKNYPPFLLNDSGTKWSRVIIDPWGSWQQVDWDADEYTIDPSDEKVIDDLVSNDIKVMLVLDIWHPNSRTVFLKTDEDIAIYTNWVRFMVRHFKGCITYYEILNEPDLSFSSPSGMPVDAYVNLVNHTVPVIREEDPNAKIVLGAVPDTRWPDARWWLWDLLNSGVMPLVDGVSWHGMYGAAPSDDPRGIREREPQVSNYWETYPDFVEEIKSVAAANGFEGEFMSEEMIWRTPAYQPHESEPWGFTDISGAKYFARAIIIHLGLDVASGLAVVPGDDRPVSYSVIQALSTVMAGAQPEDLPLVIESDATNIKYYGFTLPNGEKLLAIWTDGPAVEDDPGILLTLTFPDFSAERVTGIDILNRFEQQIVTEDDSGNLVIHGLLVKDYPLILRITP